MSSGATTGPIQATASSKDKPESMEECDKLNVPWITARPSQDLEMDAASPANDCSDVSTIGAAAPANNCSDVSTTDTPAPANHLNNLTTDAAAPANDCSDVSTTDTTAPAPNPSGADKADKYILVFGSAGAGKSTLINHIAGFDLPVSSDALGMTHSVKERLFEHAGVKYCITDTSGLNQDHRGVVPGETAESELKNLLRKTAHHGLNLMIMVTCGRIAETLDNNYDLFVNTMTSNKVPLIIVQTHLDDEVDLGQWAADNERYFKNGGNHAKQIVGTAFPKFNFRRESSDSWSKETIQESTDRVWKAIEEHSSPTPKIFCERGAIGKLLGEIYSKFGRHVVKHAKKRIFCC